MAEDGERVAQVGQRALDRGLALVDDLIGAIELEQADVAEARRDVHVLRLPGHARAGDAVLDDAALRRHHAAPARLAGLAGEIDIAITSHNVPIVDGSYMIALGRAFEEIKAGIAEYMMTDGNREYQFDGFSVIVKDEQ